MKAVYLSPEFMSKVYSGDNFDLPDHVHNHLIKVMRARQGENIIALDGHGSRLSLILEKVEKRQSTVRAMKKEDNISDNRKFHLAIGTPKKEYVETILRTAIEFGLKSVTFLETEYSQKGEPNEKRLNAILESSIIQSNNPWFPNLFFGEKIEKYLDEKKESGLILLSLGSSETRVEKIDLETCYIVGPEGGFSKEEEELLRSRGVESVCFGNSILKAATASAVGAGYLLGRMMQ